MRSRESALGEPSPAPVLAGVPKFIDKDRKCFVSAGAELRAAARATQRERENCKAILGAEHIQRGSAGAELSAELLGITAAGGASWGSNGFQDFP